MSVVEVMIVDDHPVVREGLRALLARSEVVRVVAEASDGQDSLDKLKAISVHVVLLDWMMPRLDGLETCRRITKEHPGIRVLMLTNHLDQVSVKDAIQAGATGYLLKDVSFDELETAILDVASGKKTLHQEAEDSLKTAIIKDQNDPLKSLTERELDVLKHLGAGYSNKEIGKLLGLTEGTVKGYVSAVLTKTGTSDRTQAALLAVKLGVVG